ncbi:GatB/YqeY domain-containing protein [Rhizobium leguminosarum]|uniref:GatB/YqeY domain-containing protein n=1 Tax=Rhizobium leguminosarum TaxID=384 RepID=UPI001441B833|nr:GatB/YqeY domain-containing protein [Rhizobium leguminosarum]NKK66294.1 GatB/YqeY domain-containing protein [Rhizobium leguminosarum bv. viciae]NKL09294.1 GatB/YqeY domain-containing protein [Rhizobium leguminosarum bv. viciae]NKL85457.1 GatB/YqeY domain-containing protein [Rhizobium leguminosarum bv. viciae]NKL93764.1 GatB/YqeY domain-containing protein [Rhizobium leguminosarum bv. viciae]NKM95254.1 GatB/YqeY domain-containing protein [Rhizobium leguminosarum bv. viciae]
MLRDQLATQLKEAMKAKNAERLSTVRLIQAAVKDRDIANRGIGKEQASDDEILQILAKMVKQRDESAKIYEENSRPELAAKERAEIIVIQDFMPKQLSDSEVRANISAIIAETGAAGAKDMGKVMAALKERYAGQMDFAKASATVKELLNG